MADCTMRKLALKRFTNHIFLKRLGRDLLDQFFERFPDLNDAVHAALPAMSKPDEHGRTAAFGLDYYSALAAVFMRPDRLPPSLIEDLLAIEEMSTANGLARLQRAPEWPQLQAEFRADSTAEDIAMQIWLAYPEILAREHNA